MGYSNPTHSNSVRYLGFKEYVYSEHEDDYVGEYTFESLYGNETEWQIDKFSLYSKELDQNQN